jgi:hypothetical protein
MTDTTVKTAAEAPEDIRSILGLQNVDSVRAGDKQLIVRTGIIDCKDDRTDLFHRLGAYDIHLSLERPEIMIFNTEGPREVNGHLFHAPGVSAQGHAGFGNVANLMQEFLLKKDYTLAIILAVAFLESANTNDVWGQNINLWPLSPVNPPAAD